MVDHAREARLLLKSMNDNAPASALQISQAAELCAAMKLGVDALSPMFSNLLFVESQLLAHSDTSKQLLVMRDALKLGDAVGLTGSKVQRHRQSVLALLEESLGVPPSQKFSAEEEAAEEERKGESRRKNEQARRKRDAKHDAIEASLAELHPATTSLFSSYLNPTLCGSCDTSSSPHRIDWPTVPACLHPTFETKAEVREQGKAQQLESLAFVLSTCFPTRVPPLHIVDFGAGSGNSSLVLAHLFPGHAFTLVEKKPHKSVDLIKARALEAGLTNVQTFHGDFRDFKRPFDLGLAVHLCGEATDLCMERCFEMRASFVLVPCCVGKIASVVEQQLKHGGDDAHRADGFTVTYPRSEWLKARMETEMYLNCTRSADFSEKVGTRRGQMSKQLIDIDRAKSAQERGYAVSVGRLEPVECSRKHDIIVGRLKRD